MSIIDIGDISPRGGFREFIPQLNVPRGLSDAHPAVDVAIETGPGNNEFAATRWDFKSVTLGRDGDDTTATLVIGLDAEQLTSGGAIGDEHFSQLIEQLNPDHRVRISQRLGASGQLVYFMGYPQVPSLSWGPSQQSVRCTCLSEGHEIMRTGSAAQVLGRLMRYDPLADWNPANTDETMVSALGVVFNAGNRPNRSASAFPFEGKFGGTHELHLFTEDDAPEAEFWSYAEALRYIAYFHNVDPPEGIDVAAFLHDSAPLVGQAPASSVSFNPYVKRMTQRVDQVSATSTHAEQAIALLTAAAGMHYQIKLREQFPPENLDVDHVLKIYATLENQDQVDFNPLDQINQPRVLDIPREAPFTAMGGRQAASIALANRAQESSLTIDRRAINVPIILGGFKEYEVTLLMRPGWIPVQFLDNLDTEDARDFARDFWEIEFPERPFEKDSRVPKTDLHGAHPDHWKVATVGRLWIFPDDHRYVSDDLSQSDLSRTNWPAKWYSPYQEGAPENLVLVDRWMGGSVADAANWVPRRRPFRDLIGRMRGTDERGPVVRFNFRHSDPDTALQPSNLKNWVRFTGKVYIDEQRAAITIEEDNLLNAPTLVPNLDDNLDSNSMLDAYINGHFMVSVTGVIRGDQRMTLRPMTQSSFTRLRHQISDAGTETFRSDNRRGQNSHLNAQTTDDEPSFEDRLDDDKFERYAAREAWIGAGDRVAGSISIPFVDHTYDLGDSFSGVAGLGLTFQRFSEIVGIEYLHDPQSGYKTVLHLSDLREAPEVGLE